MTELSKRFRTPGAHRWPQDSNAHIWLIFGPICQITPTCSKPCFGVLYLTENCGLIDPYLIPMRYIYLSKQISQTWKWNHKFGSFWILQRFFSSQLGAPYSLNCSKQQIKVLLISNFVPAYKYTIYWYLSQSQSSLNVLEKTLLAVTFPVASCKL